MELKKRWKGWVSLSLSPDLLPLVYFTLPYISDTRV